jgi:hypothetical protein
MKLIFDNDMFRDAMKNFPILSHEGHNNGNL